MTRAISLLDCFDDEMRTLACEIDAAREDGVHPSAIAWCGEWQVDLHRAVMANDAREALRLRDLIRRKLADERAWYQRCLLQPDTRPDGADR
jgi:hypothetical protein